MEALGDNPFQIIHQSLLLPESDYGRLLALKGELQETFLKSQVFRTRTEMEVSVLDDLHFPTPASKYWQAVREQNVMFIELVELSYEYRKKVIEMKKLDRRLEAEVDVLDRELLQIEIERTQFHLRQMEKVARDRLREICHWSEIKAQLAEKMSDVELANVDNHQLVSYTKRWLKQALNAGDTGSPSERNNLYGQLYSGVNRCKELGLFDEVLKGFDPVEKSIIQNNLKVLS